MAARPPLRSPPVGIGTFTGDLIATAVFFAIGVAGGLHSIVLVNIVQAIEAICVTHNVAEFRRVTALETENWLQQV